MYCSEGRNCNCWCLESYGAHTVPLCSHLDSTAYKTTICHVSACFCGKLKRHTVAELKIETGDSCVVCGKSKLKDLNMIFYRLWREERGGWKH